MIPGTTTKSMLWSKYLHEISVKWELRGKAASMKEEEEKKKIPNGMDGMDFNIKAYKIRAVEQERRKKKREKMNMVNSAHNHDL